MYIVMDISRDVRSFMQENNVTEVTWPLVCKCMNRIAYKYPTLPLDKTLESCVVSTMQEYLNKRYRLIDACIRSYKETLLNISRLASFHDFTSNEFVELDSNLSYLHHEWASANLEEMANRE